MSHVAEIDLQVQDLDSLKAAVAAEGCEWLEGQKTHRWYGQFLADSEVGRRTAAARDPRTFGKCEHAIRVPGVNYEIGVVKSQDGTGYKLIYDDYGSSGQHDGHKISAKFGGQNLPTLKQGYATQVTIKDLRRKGYRVTTVKTANGDIKVKAVK